MLYIIIIIVSAVVLTLAWLEIIPVRLWIIKAKTRYYGKKTRIKIRIIKALEPLLALLE